MVAQKGRWHIKWRYRCATCGVAFAKAQRWAYCNKTCETGRRGYEPADQPEDGLRQYLDLDREREHATHWEREAIEARMAVLLQPEVVPVRELTLTGNVRDPATMLPTAPEFWLPVLGEEWDRFESTIRRGLGSAITLGKRLQEAKAALPHGEFGRLFADHEQPVPGAMRFTARWAQKLMAIAENKVIAKHASHLPPDLESVYHLSRVAPETLEQAIASGAVRPMMRREDARKLVVPDPGPPSSADDLIVECLQSVKRPLAAFAKASPALFVEMAARLKAILRDLGRRAAKAGAS